MSKSCEQVVAVLGVLQSGAAYLPLDVELPQQRLWQLLEDAQVQLVVTQKELGQRLSWPASVQVLWVEGNADEDESVECTELPEVAADALAYVIYT